MQNNIAMLFVGMLFGAFVNVSFQILTKARFNWLLYQITGLALINIFGILFFMYGPK